MTTLLAVLTVQSPSSQLRGPGQSGMPVNAIVLAVAVISCLLLALVWMLWPWFRRRAMVASIQRWLRQQP